MNYTKLFSSIVASTIWREDDKTRIVWITMLALSDKDGVVEGSIPGLADLARVSVEDCKRALENLQKADEYSRTPDHQGRRIQPIDDGWLILNRAKYRDKHWKDDNADRRKEINRRYYENRELRSIKTDLRPVESLSDSLRDKEEKQKEKKKEREKSNAVSTSEHAWFVAKGVSINLRLAGQDILSILHDQAEFELKDGARPEDLGNRMTDAWREYEKVNAEAKFGVKNFFATGEWRKHKPISLAPRKSASQRMAEVS
jgi:hypothetical protein